MAKFQTAANQDAALAIFEGNTIAVCSGQPTDFASVAGLTLATQSLVGSYVKAAGSPDGRKNTCPEQVDVAITATGTATHVAITDGVSDLKQVTTCTSQALTSGGTVTVPAWDHTLRDPA